MQKRETGIAERMDDGACDPAELARTYRDFDRVNALLSGWRGIYKRHLRPLLQGVGRNASVLDIGCGGGDVLRRLATWTRRDGLDATFTGADPDPRAIRFAESLPPMPGIGFECATAQELARAGKRYDIVLSNHLLHHLTDPEVADLCATCERFAPRLVLHADICRSPVAYAAFPLIGGWFRDSFILPDGLQSIRRSFTAPELRRVAPPDWQVRKAFPFRLHLWWTP